MRYYTIFVGYYTVAALYCACSLFLIKTFITAAVVKLDDETLRTFDKIIIFSFISMTILIFPIIIAQIIAMIRAIFKRIRDNTPINKIKRHLQEIDKEIAKHEGFVITYSTFKDGWFNHRDSIRHHKERARGFQLQKQMVERLLKEQIEKEQAEK